MKIGAKKKIKGNNKSKSIVKTHKKNFWLRTLEDINYDMLREMNNSNVAISQWQKQRILKSLVLIPVTIGFYLFMNNWKYLIGGFAFTIVFYVIQAKKIKNIYNQFKFERHLQFSKFTRLLIPYLKQKKDGGNLYSVFNKIVKRLDYETDKRLLMKLMQEMTDYPNDIRPFVEYAEQTSGTDMSVLFMSTVFDIKQGLTDLDVIEELDRLASEELMAGVKSIIEFKCRKFAYFPTKIAMSSFIIVIGFAIAVLVFNLKDINFIRGF
ncbi:TPA: hypothetical protein PL519_003480 [Clostridium botulinum]|nr:hypothetical protein [Clostridium botulinum]